MYRFNIKNDRLCVSLALDERSKIQKFLSVEIRETREGWPLPPIGTEANGDSHSRSTYRMKEILP
jgi:hypothetical protein